MAGLKLGSIHVQHNPLGMLFVLVIFKSVLHVVLCVRYGVVMYHGVGEEKLLRREKEEKGEGCCLRTDLCMGRPSSGHRAPWPVSQTA